jgi:hypothetical protein
MGLVNHISNEALAVKNALGELTMREAWIGVLSSVKAVRIEVRDPGSAGLEEREYWTNDFNWDVSPGGCVWFNVYDHAREDADITFAVSTEDNVRVVDDAIYAKDVDDVEIIIHVLAAFPVPFSVRSK